MMQRRCPPSSAFRRLTAWSVVPEPAKKSTMSALGLLARITLSESLTAYKDFGYGKFLPGSKFRMYRVPNSPALCRFLFHTVFTEKSCSLSGAFPSIRAPCESRPNTSISPDSILFSVALFRYRSEYLSFALSYSPTRAHPLAINSLKYSGEHLHRPSTPFVFIGHTTAHPSGAVIVSLSVSNGIESPTLFIE